MVSHRILWYVDLFMLRCLVDVDPVPSPAPDRNIKLPLIEVPKTIIAFYA